MTDQTKASTTRRDFLKTTGTIAAASTLAAASVPAVHAQGSSITNIALVGCGGRGTGAAANAMHVPNGPTKLVAMADVFQDRLDVSHKSLSTQKFPNEVDVPKDRQFLGFDAYKNAIDCLGPGDVAIFTTPLAFRWVHFTYAIEKGVNVFMEKPVIADGPSARRMLELGKKAEAKNLKVAVGLMCRHCKARQAAANLIHDGAIGDVIALRAYRMAGPTGSAATGPKPEGMTDLEWQIRRFHGFLWASGGAVSDFLIHNIDEACWVKNDWPVQAKASGGRHYRGDMIDQNFDSYSLEYTFADGTKLDVNGRTIPGCHNEFATYAHGTKGSAIFSTAGHVPAKSRFYKGHNFVKKELAWAYPEKEPNPYQVEWNDLIAAIKDDKKYSELERGVKSSVATSMGRMAAHTGQIITYDDMLNCEHEFAPGIDKMTYDSTPPVVPDSNGKYPIPLPGLNQDREYT
ncbi:MAG: streptomycin biosynthesis protein StrI [Planctomycetaceae bacterium]|nr:streptomycin biosynthesis protein StrI [Planctomycetaceae bacterium]